MTRTSILRLATAASAALGFAAQAATLTVTVTDKEGLAVPDAAVLLRYSVPPTSRPSSAGTAVIAQEKLRFVPYLTIISPSTTVQFVNRDAFDHHVVATPPMVGVAQGKSFETRLPPDPNKPFSITLTEPGGHALSCHLHSRMRGYIYVADTPWFGKTDSAGQIVLKDLPDGPVEVQTWHPEQFTAQPVLRAQLGATPAELSSPLNFSPRVRRAN